MADREALQHELAALTGFLSRFRHVWEPRPFVKLPVPWEAEHPALSRFLRGLDPEVVDVHHAAPARLSGAPAPFHDWTAGSEALTQVPPARTTSPRLGRRWAHQVSARKRKQAPAFAAAAAAKLPRGAGRWVDWCAGKGHLGRALGTLTGRPVLFVERRRELCDAARARATADGVEASGECRDVLEGTATLGPRAGERPAVAALHACGVLGDTAIAAAVAEGASLVALAPCCPHHHPDSARLPLRSAAGRAHPLAISPAQLRLATAEEISAAPRRRLRRRRQQAFRLGLDLLLREASGRDEYTLLPSIPHAWFHASFGDWVKRVAAEGQLRLPARWSAPRAEARGWERAQQVAALGLARGCFRRALELWVVIDRALWLAEAGFEVELVTFCAREDSPRNLLILGAR